MGSSTISVAASKSVESCFTRIRRRVAGSGGSGASKRPGSALTERRPLFGLMPAPRCRCDHCQVMSCPGTTASAWPGSPPSISASTAPTTSSSLAIPLPRVASLMSTLPLEPMPLTASPMPVSAVYVGHSAVIRMRFERYSDGAALRVNISTPDLVAAYMGWWGIGHSPPAEATFTIAPPSAMWRSQSAAAAKCDSRLTPTTASAPAPSPTPALFTHARSVPAPQRAT
mmetsp:Transcript_13985/g.43810  ORF Transcript_13985/g.43810 Transcript_13985/m.43810 type:complete len:228 (+) Transcript_13985:839-1522(+)